MNINHDICPLQILKDGIRSPFGHRSFGISWENTIHIKVKVRNATRNGIDAQRIKRRINFERTIQLIQIFFYQFSQLKAHILSFQFITMGTRHHANTFLTLPMANNMLFTNKRSSTGSAMETIVFIIFLQL